MRRSLSCWCIERIEGHVDSSIGVVLGCGRLLAAARWSKPVIGLTDRPVGRSHPVERVVLVTGAGSGIGLATTLEAARLGFTAVGAVHRDDQADTVRSAARDAGVGVEVETLDVTDDEAVRHVIERRQPWGLVNNAGLMWPGLLAEQPLDEGRHHLDVMLLAPIRLVQLALPAMRRQGEGRIVNVSSIAGDANGPMLGWYETTKRALTTLSDALRPELAAWGIDVVVVEPGPCATPIWDKANARLQGEREGSTEPHVYDRTIEMIGDLAARAGDAADVAEVVGEVLRAGRPRFRYRVGASAGLVAGLGRVVPTSVKDRFTRAVAGL
jgi:NAD(P)-dependent dehydrogenase (short-subunit alcohol dehydrogenase family)